MIVLAYKDMNTNICEFRANSASEIAYLPTTIQSGTGNLSTVAHCASGSSCFVTSTGDIYFLNGDTNTWNLLE